VNTSEAMVIVLKAADDYAEYLQERQENLTENLEHQEEIDQIDAAIRQIKSVW
jgi:prefoldin subunit 5